MFWNDLDEDLRKLVPAEFALFAKEAEQILLDDIPEMDTKAAFGIVAKFYQTEEEDRESIFFFDRVNRKIIEIAIGIVWDQLVSDFPEVGVREVVHNTAVHSFVGRYTRGVS